MRETGLTEQELLAVLMSPLNSYIEAVNDLNLNKGK